MRPSIIVGFCLLLFSATCVHTSPPDADTTVSFLNKFTINKHHFIGYIKDDQFILTTTNGKTIIKMNGDYNGWELKDIDGNGYKVLCSQGIRQL